MDRRTFLGVLGIASLLPGKALAATAEPVKYDYRWADETWTSWSDADIRWVPNIPDAWPYAVSCNFNHEHRLGTLMIRDDLPPDEKIDFRGTGIIKINYADENNNPRHRIFDGVKIIGPVNGCRYLFGYNKVYTDYSIIIGKDGYVSKTYTREESLAREKVMVY